MDQGSKQGKKRSYPPFWERAVPYIIILIMVLLLGLAAVAITVALGVFPFGT